MRGRSAVPRFSPICACLVLLGCAPSPKPSTTASLDTTAAYIVCLHHAAVALDDHMSEVGKIASAVADRCSAEFDAGVETIARGMGPVEAAIFEHKAAKESLKLAAAAVREERLEKQDRH